MSIGVFAIAPFRGEHAREGLARRLTRALP